MSDYIYCIYLGKDKSSIGPLDYRNVLLLVSGRYQFLGRNYFHARANFRSIE